jgi:malonyl-CoA/methylmalonyl-CoA synthetase
MNLISLFNISLIDRKNKTALIFGDEQFTFGDIDARSNRTANLLLAKGFTAGDRLAVYLENCVEIIDLFLACAKTGIIFVPVNILYKEREMSHILSDADPKALIAKGEIPCDFKAWQLDDLINEVKDQAAKPIDALVTGDSPAALVYTSGTTGASKGAILTHNNFMANGVNLNACWKITEDDRFLLTLPLFHVHALANGVHCWLMSGCTMKLLPRFEHGKAAEGFLSFKPTLFFGVPTIYIRLLDQPADIAKQIGANARLFVCGSAPLPAHILEEFEVKYGHIILERYGMTETLMNISNPYVGERRPGSIGFPLPGISAKIITADGTEAGFDEEGEVHIKGPNVFAGYWRREQATVDAFSNGYFKTGDMGVMAADGYFTLRGRKSDLIISGGFNIYPREIEDYLLEQNGVAEVAVVGIPHETRGEMPVAYIVPGKSYDAAAIEEGCKNAFASFKVPRSFILVESLPRTALGKVQKHLLPKP